MKIARTGITLTLLHPQHINLRELSIEDIAALIGTSTVRGKVFAVTAPTDIADLFALEACQEIGLDSNPFATLPESCQFWTIQIGCGTDVPLQDGGTGPDEPVWYFDVREQFDRALKLAEQLDLPCVQAGCSELPEGECVSDFSEFAAYARMQADPVNQLATLENDHGYL